MPDEKKYGNPFEVVADLLFGGILDAGKDLVETVTGPIKEVGKETPHEGEEREGRAGKGVIINVYGNKRVKRKDGSAEPTASKEKGTSAGNEKQSDKPSGAGSEKPTAA